MPHDIAPEPDTRILRRALGGFATGVCVVTADGAGGPVGITVNSFISVSLSPATILWSLARGGTRWEAFSEVERFAIHVLDADGEALSRRFAWGDPRLSADEHEAHPSGVPLITDGWVSRFVCCATSRIDVGDHRLILAGVDSFETRDRPGLVLFRGGYGVAREDGQ